MYPSASSAACCSGGTCWLATGAVPIRQAASSPASCACASISTRLQSERSPGSVFRSTVLERVAVTVRDLGVHLAVIRGEHDQRTTVDALFLQGLEQATDL